MVQSVWSKNVETPLFAGIYPHVLIISALEIPKEKLNSKIKKDSLQDTITIVQKSHWS